MPPWATAVAGAAPTTGGLAETTAEVGHHVASGGTKASNHGPRGQGSYAREFCTTVKTAYVNPE